MSRKTSGAVALLNASYEPLGHVDFKHAVRMLFREVAVVEVAHEDKMIGPHPWPRVLRLVRYVVQKWTFGPAKWTREGTFARDRHRCAYCGRHAKTIDHLFPESRGGKWSWTNCVAACNECNERKGNRTPEEAGMRLRYAEPYVPTKDQVAQWMGRKNGF